VGREGLPGECFAALPKIGRSSERLGSSGEVETARGVATQQQRLITRESACRRDSGRGVLIA